MPRNYDRTCPLCKHELMVKSGKTGTYAKCRDCMYRVQLPEMDIKMSSKMLVLMIVSFAGVTLSLFLIPYFDVVIPVTAMCASGIIMPIGMLYFMIRERSLIGNRTHDKYIYDRINIKIREMIINNESESESGDHIWEPEKMRKRLEKIDGGPPVG